MMHCPDCGAQTTVINTCHGNINDVIYTSRYRKCTNHKCLLRFYTREMAIWELPEALQQGPRNQK